jgi:DNA uptake protein ComE-like DNA-binding protein
MKRNSGFILIIVLVIVATLSIAMLAFSELMLSELRGAKTNSRSAQARALSDSGIDAALQFLSAPLADQFDQGGRYDNPTRFRSVLVVEDPVPSERGRFTIIAPGMQDGTYQGERFGLEDESAKINVNTLVTLDKLTRTSSASSSSNSSAATSTSGTSGTAASTTSGGIASTDGSSTQAASTGGRTALMTLPNMTEEIADAILDWLDSDDTPRANGAESQYYGEQGGTHMPKNGPIDTLEDLLQVRGVTADLLYGADLNRNGRIDPSESQLASNFDEQSMRGWSAYLTVYSAEGNLRADGTAKLNLNDTDLQTLFTNLQSELGPDWANYIIAVRQYGLYSGQTPGGSPSTLQIDTTKTSTYQLSSVLDLVGTQVQQSNLANAQSSNGQGQSSGGQSGSKSQGGNAGGGTIAASPCTGDAASITSTMPKVLEACSVSTSTSIRGRININQAPRVVLMSIPGMTDVIADAIVAKREGEPTANNAIMRYDLWPLAEGIMTMDDMTTMYPYLCAGGSVFRAQVVGYFDQNGPASRVEAVLDATVSPARLVFWRDMTQLGRGYPLEELGIDVGQ